jgi:hypothetical protein
MYSLHTDCMATCNAIRPKAVVAVLAPFSRPWEAVKDCTNKSNGTRYSLSLLTNFSPSELRIGLRLL